MVELTYIVRVAFTPYFTCCSWVQSLVCAGDESAGDDWSALKDVIQWSSMIGRLNTLGLSLQSCFKCTHLSPASMRVPQPKGDRSLRLCPAHGYSTIILQSLGVYCQAIRQFMSSSGLFQACTSNERKNIQEVFDSCLLALFKHQNNWTRSQKRARLNLCWNCWQKYRCPMKVQHMSTKRSTLVRSRYGLTVHLDPKALWYIFVEQPCT